MVRVRTHSRQAVPNNKLDMARTGQSRRASKAQPEKILMPKKYRSYTPEFKSRAVDLCLQSIVVNNWSLRRFARRSGIPTLTVHTWVMEPDTFERYTQAMKLKALELPLMANDIVAQVIHGKPVRYVEEGANGELVEKVKRVFLEPKAAGVALRHIEFRIQREIKKIYEPTKSVSHKHTHKFSEMPDDEVERQFAEMQQKIADSVRKKNPDSPESVH